MVTILKFKRDSLSVHHCFRCSDGLGGGFEEDEDTGYRPRDVERDVHAWRADYSLSPL